MMKTLTPRAIMARIVIDTRDARRDRFIPLDDAKRMFEQGELVQLIDMGYPNSYMRIGKDET